MSADIVVSPLVANLVWIAFLGICLRLWLGHARRVGGPTLTGERARSSFEGVRLLSLILTTRGWIAGREDTVELVDGLWLDCSISVRLGPIANRAGSPGEIKWIPLEILPKATTTNVDIRTSGVDGEPVPRWPHQLRLAEQSLATLAKSILGGECSRATAAAIRAIVSSPPRAALAALRRLEQAEDAESLALTAHGVFMDLAGAFAEGELLVADTVLDHAEKHLTFSYRYRLEHPRRPRAGLPRLSRMGRRVFEAVGWRVRGFPIEFRGSFQAREHLWTVRLPELRGEAVEVITTLVTAPRSAGEKRRWHNAEIRDGALTLRLPDGDRPSEYGVRLLMQPRRGSDLLAGTLFISVFIWAALALGMIRLDAVTKHVDAMTVLLAIVPSLLVPLLWRREHALVTFMFAGLRRMAVAVFAAGFLALLALIGDFCGAGLRWTWTGAFVVASAGLATAGVASLRSPRLPPELTRSGR